MESAVAGMPRYEIDAGTAEAITHGKDVPAFGTRDGVYAVVGPDGLVSVSEDRGDVSRPICVVAEQ
jgi:hypothetical protein